VLYTRELAGIFSRAGLSEDVAYRYLEFEKAKHNEQAWSERFDQVLLFLFRKVVRKQIAAHVTQKR
jgi:hypothetical protein